MKIRELIVEQSIGISEAPTGQGFLSGLKRGLTNPWQFGGDDTDTVPSNTKRKVSSSTTSISSNYMEKIKASVMPNVAEQPSAGPVSVQLKSRPDGIIISKQITRSSGDPDWDNAILQGIEKTGKLPTDIDGRTPTTMVVDF